MQKYAFCLIIPNNCSIYLYMEYKKKGPKALLMII